MSLVEELGPTRVAIGLCMESGGILCCKMSHCLPISKPTKRDPASTERRKEAHVSPVGKTAVTHTLFSRELRGLQRRWLGGGGGGGTVLNGESEDPRCPAQS